LNKRDGYSHSYYKVQMEDWKHFTSTFQYHG